MQKFESCWRSLVDVAFRELQTKDFNADHVNDSVCETFVSRETANADAKLGNAQKFKFTRTILWLSANNADSPAATAHAPRANSGGIENREKTKFSETTNKTVKHIIECK